MANNDVGLETSTEYLFGSDFWSQEFEDNVDSFDDMIDEVRDHYSWRELYSSWSNYLRTRCPTLMSVINWENLFSYYGGGDFPLKDPYDLLGYLYYRTEPLYRKLTADDFADDRIHILESIALPQLRRTGAITLDNIDSYAINTDEKVLAVARKYRAELGPAEGVEDGPNLGEGPGDGNVGDSQ